MEEFDSLLHSVGTCKGGAGFAPAFGTSFGVHGTPGTDPMAVHRAMLAQKLTK
jgi:hypothetical protein